MATSIPTPSNPSADRAASERAVDELIGEMLTWDVLGIPDDLAGNGILDGDPDAD